MSSVYRTARSASPTHVPPPRATQEALYASLAAPCCGGASTQVGLGRPQGHHVVSITSVPCVDGDAYFKQMTHKADGWHAQNTDANKTLYLRLVEHARNVAYAVWPYGTFAAQHVVQSAPRVIDFPQAGPGAGSQEPLPASSSGGTGATGSQERDVTLTYLLQPRLSSRHRRHLQSRDPTNSPFHPRIGQQSKRQKTARSHRLTKSRHRA